MAGFSQEGEFFIGSGGVFVPGASGGFGRPPQDFITGAGGILPFNPTVDLNFALGEYFGVSGSPTTFLTTVRAAPPALAVDASGNWLSFAANVPRITNLGLLVEESRTNLFLNSQAPTTQTIAVASGSVYTASVYGNATLILSGAGAGTVSQGHPVTFTASTTSLTVTVSGAGGSFQNAQIELGSFLTSPIVTAGAAVTRAADVVRLTSPPAIGATYSFVLWGVPQAPNVSANNQIIGAVNDGGATNVAALYRQSSDGGSNVFNNGTGGTVSNFSFNAGLNNFILLPQNVLAKCAESMTGAAGMTTVSIGGQAAGANPWDGIVARMALWPTITLTGAQLQQITT